jgi:DNA polymerase phi
VATDLTVTNLLGVLATENLTNHKEEQKLFETYLGNVLTCGSIIRSPLMDTASNEEVEALLDHLQKAVEAKKLLFPYAKAFLADLIDKVNTGTFAAIVWPRIASELNVPPEKQNLNTAHCLMVARTNHPTVVTGKVLKESLKTPTFLHPDNFDWLIRLLWSLKSEIKANHSFYEYFGRQLAVSRHLAAFWSGPLEQRLGEQHKFNELLALKLAITILQNLSEDNQTTFQLITPNFTKVVLANLKKVHNNNDNLHPLYEEFFKLFLQHCSQSEAKVEIVGQFVSDEVFPILEHKNLYNAVYTSMVMHLDEAQLKEICGRLKNILTAEATEDSEKARKLGALNLTKRILAHKLVVNDAALRLEILKCLMDAGIFNVGAKKSILLREKGVNVEQNMKLAFYSLLELKLPRLSEEQDLLVALVQFCDKRLKKAGVLDDESHAVWTNVLQKVGKAPKKPAANGKINLNALVFEILLLHMGLQLFNNPTLARSSIGELESVMERVEAKKRSKKKGKQDDGEPDWIEVIVDLFLSLLSQDSSLLRNLVAHIFPRLSKDVTPTAFNQILSVLDLKENPLTAIEKDENIDEIEDSEDDEDDSEGEGAEAGDSDNDDFLDESDVEMEEGGDEGNITDRVRSVIHAALGTAGAETDTESLDLDDMDETEGKRVDDALAAAFKLLKTGRKTKPTKTDRENELQLNHFRMRVFDLIESYLKSSPSMACCLELMMFIYEQLPLAIKEPEKHKTVLKKFHYVFDSLTKIKAFENCGDVTQAQLAQLLSDLFEKVAKGASFAEKTACLSNSALFIIQCSKILAKVNDADKDVIRDIFTANLREFFTHRQPTLALNMLEIIFKLPWLVLWDLCDIIVDTGLLLATRNLRRCNSLQLLTLIFKNIRLIQTDVDLAAKKLPAIEVGLNGYMAGLQQQDQIAENEFTELLALLVAVFDFHKRYPQVKNKLNTGQAKGVVEKFRPSIVLKAQETNLYTRLCATLEIQPCLNKQLAGDTKKAGLANGGGKKTQKRARKDEVKQSDKEAKKAKLTNGAVGKTANDGSKQKVDNKKARRVKKEERLKASAEGLIENFSFAV